MKLEDRRLYRDLRRQGLTVQEAKDTMILMGLDPTPKKPQAPLQQWVNDIDHYSSPKLKPKLPYFHGKRRF